MPGLPREEECNFLDDDCNGLVDDDAYCPAGNACIAGECRPDDGTATPSPDTDDGEPSPVPDTDGDPGAAAVAKGCTVSAERSTPGWAALVLLAFAARRRPRRRSKAGLRADSAATR